MNINHRDLQNSQRETLLRDGICIFCQQLNRMGITVERSIRGNWESQSGCTTPNSILVTSEVRSSDANSPLEASSQRDIGHVSCQSRIKELEELASSRQKEVFEAATITSSVGRRL